LVGAIRTGKDSVANFLIETRGFEQIAFADQIKEEFGISNADFEAAKIAGNIEQLREELWAFSAKKKEENPTYFIDKVIDRAMSSDKSVIITDIRTQDELDSFLKIESGITPRVYWVKGRLEQENINGCLAGSKLSEKMIVDYMEKYDIRCIFNNAKGLFGFYQWLDTFFFVQDIRDLWEKKYPYVMSYVSHFEVRQKGVV